MPGDESSPGSYADFGSGDLDRDMWRRPNPELGDAWDILAYALTVDGYAYARAILGLDLRELQGELQSKWRGPQRSTMTFVELRLLLFWEQRAAHQLWQGGSIDGVALKSGPDEDDERRLRELNQAICAAWDREWPKRRGSTMDQ